MLLYFYAYDKKSLKIPKGDNQEKKEEELTMQSSKIKD
jgi:hypothetical protein